MRQAVSDTPSTPSADDSMPAGPQADSGQPPVIDEKVLCEAVGCDVGEEGELVLRVLAMFEQHGPPSLLKLAESAQNQGSAQIADTAHALKSMCRNIGAIRLGEACDRLESEAKGGQIENLTEQLASLQTELVTVLERIKQIRSAQQQPDKLANLEM
jgi:HPt (histidine-containing phosphotransfer) domain-containing protein